MVVRVFGKWCDDQGIDDLLEITPDDVRAYVDHESRQGLAQSTLANRFVRLNTFFNWCVQNGYLDNGQNPCDRLKRPRMPKSAAKAFDREQIRRLFKVLEAKPGWTGARDRAVFTLMLGTGLRAREVVNLQINDLDWPGRRVLVRKGKGDKYRRVPMGAGTMRALREYLKVRPTEPCPMLWVSQRKGPMNYWALEAMIRHLGEYADVKPCHAHLLRHTYATEHYLAHRDILALKNLLGHTQVQVTMRYLDKLGVDYTGSERLSSPDEWLK